MMHLTHGDGVYQNPHNGQYETVQQLIEHGHHERAIAITAFFNYLKSVFNGLRHKPAGHMKTVKYC